MLKNLLRISLLILFLCLSLIARDIYLFSLTSSYDPADAAVVLGTSVFRDRPSPVFSERINHAINLYQAGIVQYIIFTGGQAGNDRLAETEAGRNYAMERGVPAERIFIETAYYNTCLNLIEAKRIIDENNLDQVLIVSDPLHMRRSMWLAEKI